MGITLYRRAVSGYKRFQSGCKAGCFKVHFLYEARVVESVDTRDLKSLDPQVIPVRVWSRAPLTNKGFAGFCEQSFFVAGKIPNVMN